jgi:hypothetical protein
MKIIEELQKKRQKKYQEYQDTDPTSWKKQAKKLELEILDIKIKYEKLKSRYN